MRVIKRLGSGGFGVVDLVEYPDGSQYARKTFSENQILTPEMRRNVILRFNKEARTQKSLSHRNIVPVVLDALEDDPPYYLMPVAECSLDRDISSDRTLQGNFLSTIGDIVSALEELHSVEIFHRDLKPQNVLRFSETKDGQQSSYYALSDFGLISLKESQLSVLTSTGMAKGSDHYTAPEITSDLRKASIRSDVYSLGCIIHDIVGTATRVPCAEIREDGPYGHILGACTRFDPKRRFGSARSVLDALVSVGISSGPAESMQAADLVSELSAEGPLTARQWIAIAEMLDRTGSEQDKRAICAAIDVNKIENLYSVAPESAPEISDVFASWVFDSEFGFEYCDGLANRLESFFDFGNFETKVQCLVAMLEMGTTHNRWFVERKFYRICGQDMDPALAKRLGIEFRVRDTWVCRAIAHLERSIGVSRSRLHPELVGALASICKS